MDSPSGFWGEFQLYRRRAADPRRRPVTRTPWTSRRSRSATSASGTTKTCPSDNTFDKYQVPYFQEKHVRGRGPRRPAEHRLRGRELGLLRLGHHRLSRCEGGAGASASSISSRRGGASISTTPSSVSCRRRPASASPSQRDGRAAARLRRFQPRLDAGRSPSTTARCPASASSELTRLGLRRRIRAGHAFRCCRCEISAR